MISTSTLFVNKFARKGGLPVGCVLLSDTSPSVKCKTNLPRDLFRQDRN